MRAAELTGGPRVPGHCGSRPLTPQPGYGRPCQGLAQEKETKDSFLPVCSVTSSPGGLKWVGLEKDARSPLFTNKELLLAIFRTVGIRSVVEPALPQQPWVPGQAGLPWAWGVHQLLEQPLLSNS